MVGVIADDLTGAAELGAVGLRYGLKAEILISEAPSGGSDLVCADTASRSLPPEDAAANTAAAARSLRSAGADWLYKKVDSVLRGNVLAEVQAAMGELGLSRALIVPANPLLGRVIRNGVYYVRGKPINETEFANDPEHPRKSANVNDLLGGAATVKMARWPRPIPESGIAIGEAEAPQDLQRWAAAADPKKILAAGGAEYFGALLGAAGLRPGSADTGARAADAKEVQLFICGSASESTCSFTRDAQAKGTPTISLPEAVASGPGLGQTESDDLVERVSSALQTNQRAVVHVGLPLLQDRGASARLLNELGAVAQRIIRSSKVDHIFAEGGSTAAEIVRRMGWTRLKVVREEARGVVTVAPEGAGELLLTMKPGSYVWPARLR